MAGRKLKLYRVNFVPYANEENREVPPGTVEEVIFEPTTEWIPGEVDESMFADGTSKASETGRWSCSGDSYGVIRSKGVLTIYRDEFPSTVDSQSGPRMIGCEHEGIGTEAWFSNKETAGLVGRYVRDAFRCVIKTAQDRAIARLFD